MSRQGSPPGDAKRNALLAVEPVCWPKGVSSTPTGERAAVNFARLLHIQRNVSLAGSRQCTAYSSEGRKRDEDYSFAAVSCMSRRMTLLAIGIASMFRACPMYSLIRSLSAA